MDISCEVLVSVAADLAVAEGMFVDAFMFTFINKCNLGHSFRLPVGGSRHAYAGILQHSHGRVWLCGQMRHWAPEAVGHCT
jgi:hypothetical protein